MMSDSLHGVTKQSRDGLSGGWACMRRLLGTRRVVGPNVQAREAAGLLDRGLEQRDVVFGDEGFHTVERRSRGRKGFGVDFERHSEVTDVGRTLHGRVLGGTGVDRRLVGKEETNGRQVGDFERGFGKGEIEGLDLVRRKSMRSGDVRAQAVLKLGEIEDIEVGRDGLGHSVEGTGLIMSFGVAGRAGWDVDRDAVELTAELDGNPGGGRLGRHGKRGEYRGNEEGCR